MSAPAGSDDDADGIARFRLGSRWLLAGVAVLLVLSQAVLALLAGRITHETAAASFGAVLALIALVAGPAALGFAAGPALARVGAGRTAFVLMVATGLVMRLVWLGSPAPLEDDFNRYLWDGAVLVAGHDPYAVAPEAVVDKAPQAFAPLLAAGHDVVTRINFPELTSIYPGTAQIAFAAAHLLAPWRVDGLRVVFGLADAATLALLVAAFTGLRRPRLLAAYYWCNPLVVLATTATAHVDALLPPLVLATVLLAHRGRAVPAAAMLALATGVKLWPVLLAPLLAAHLLAAVRPAGAGARLTLAGAVRQLLAPAGVFAVIAAALCLPVFATALRADSGLAAYGATWANNNAIFAWTEDIIETLLDGLVDIDVGRWLRAASAIAAVCLALIVALRPRPVVGTAGLHALLVGGLVIAAGVFYLSPAEFPWYALWFMPLAAAIEFRPLLLASALLPVYYLSFPLSAVGEEDVFNFGFALVHALPVLVWSAWVTRRNGCNPP